MDFKKKFNLYVCMYVCMFNIHFFLFSFFSFFHCSPLFIIIFYSFPSHRRVILIPILILIANQNHLAVRVRMMEERRRRRRNSKIMRGNSSKMICYLYFEELRTKSYEVGYLFIAVKNPSILNPSEIAKASYRCLSTSLFSVCPSNARATPN